MKKVTIFLAIVMLLALTAVSAFANFTSVSGIVHDSKTNSPWTHDGTVTVYNCNDIGGVALGSSSIDTTTGIFSISPITDPNADRFLCVEFVFNNGGTGTPNDKFVVINDVAGNSGDEDLGIVYTDTGPTAVSLQNVAADSNTTTAVGIGFVVLMLAGATFVLFRRREVA